MAREQHSTQFSSVFLFHESIFFILKELKKVALPKYGGVSPFLAMH